MKRHPRLAFWSHVREFAVPASMIETATSRRRAGDWSGACAAARVDVDLHLRALHRSRGRELVDLVRADLRALAPDLLRWHFPRIRPDGLLRPGLTVSLARYRLPGDEVHLVARTPPAWADAGQRISLALWERSGPLSGARPDQRFRLDLHRHLWDVRRVSELRDRCGADQVPADGRATHRWEAEAALLLREDGHPGTEVAVRLGARHRVVVDLHAPGSTVKSRRANGIPVLPDAATWVLPDLELWRAGVMDAERLHPLVRSALLPDHPAAAPRSPGTAGTPRLVDCRGSTHRIGVVGGVLVPLDHDPAEIRREELLAALGGTSLPCVTAIDAAHRNPADLDAIRARLDHGDFAGALAVVEDLLGPDAPLLDGALREELETAAERKVAHGLYRAELHELPPLPSSKDLRVPRGRGRWLHAALRRP
ncbi:hypothetical protein [Lentzea sp. NPDC003310]|uniref:hypothetical protein n=1 Tax=Lentzea sp. NPDC003310 TaxID=3154447 RepID=UPI0033AD7847